MRTLIRIVLVMLVLGVAGVAGLYFKIESEAKAPIDPNGKENVVEFKVPKGATLNQVGRQLEDEKLIKSAMVLRLYVRLHGGAAPKAGRHRVNPAMNIPALLEALKDSDLEVRRTAVWALGQIEDSGASAALREALKDTDRRVKFGALRALVAIGDEAAYDALAEMLKDPDPEVRRMAAQALGRGGINWPEPRPQPQPQPQPQPRPRPHGG